MLRDARELEAGTVIKCDLCVVGAGAAGITIARALADTGIRLCLVESGGLEFGEQVQELYKGKNVGQPYFDLDICRLRMFGGTTNHWEGRCRPFDAIDFEAREWVPHSGWPITLADLEPFYRRAQEICQLGPFEYRGEDWLLEGETLVPFAPERIESLVWQYSPPTRFGEVYRADLERAGNLDVLLHGSVVEIEANEALSKLETLRLSTLEGKRLAVRARSCVLACGGLENPRLLLASNRQAQGGLGNGQGLVGRYFMEHPHIVAARALVADPAFLAFYDYKMRTTPRRGHSVLGCMHLSEQAQRAEGLLNYDASVTVDNIGDSGYAALRRIWNSVERGESPDDLVADLKTALFDIDDTFAGLLGRFGVRDYQVQAGSFRLWSYLEQAPNPESRVFLDDERDALGMPRIGLDWRLTELDKRSLLRTHEILAEELGRTGIGRLQIEAWLQDAGAGWSEELSGGYHPMGTTRMADDPARGVVDRDGRVHGIANLYVAGSSVFPTGGSANPTLTIVALALRLAEHLRAELAV